MMPEFIHRMRYSGMAWQVCHASHHHVFYSFLRLRYLQDHRADLHQILQDGSKWAELCRDVREDKQETHQ